MKPKEKHLGLHIDDEVHYKLRYISQYEGRSMTGQVLYLIRRCIADFERENGRIERPREEET